ncbi:hypothetical protein [Glycomyces rhizosphaerae]|uniref:Septum formation initiator n=1 Tax=Glycomyces rhizosphaerae TaxID=2054422 RepID=A0ABV7PRV8_9ACTN
MKRNLVVSGWVAAAVVAVGAGIGAVALAQGGSLAPPTEPMSEESVRAALDEAADDATPTTDASADTSAVPSSAAPTGPLEEVPTGDAASGEELIATDGGTVLARCSGGEVELVWWVPAQGWRATAVEPGPAAAATFGFTADDDDDDGLDYKVTCVDGVPAAALRSGDDDADD